jgi:hypothetical protein
MNLELFETLKKYVDSAFFISKTTRSSFESQPIFSISPTILSEIDSLQIQIQENQYTCNYLDSMFSEYNISFIGKAMSFIRKEEPTDKDWRKAQFIKKLFR